MTSVQQKLCVEGIFVDPVVRRFGNVKKDNLTSSVEQVVGSLCQTVVRSVNQTFELDQADSMLNAEFCKARIYPPVAEKNPTKPIGEVFAGTEDTTMTVLFEPFDNQKAIIANNMTAKSTSLRAMQTMLSDIQDKIEGLTTNNQRLTEDVKNLKADNHRLTEDVKNLKADNHRLKADNHRLTEDVKNLKADNQRLKAVNRQLSMDVLVHGQDIENLKAANKKLKEDHAKEIGKLESQHTHHHNETFKKSNEDRKLLESQNERLTERVDTLQNQNKEMKKQLSYHTRCFKTLVPLHLRVLLDLAYHDIITKLHIGSWDEFVGDQTFDQVVDDICRGLANHKNRLSRKAIEYLCTFNEICRLRNVAAHTATKKDIAVAYHDWQDDEERGFVAELYSFHYGEDILSVSLD